MLRQLRLRNLAVAEDVVLELGRGLNVLTGSTGAGKSLVGEALRWLSGAPVDRGLIREGAQEASAECVFEFTETGEMIGRLRDIGVDCGSDGHLVLRRELPREGRARAFVNGALASAALLGRIHELLFELQSQHQQLVLLDPTAHVDLLDAGLPTPDTRNDWRTAYDEYRAVEREIASVEERLRLAREQQDVLEFQRRELRQAQLHDGELEELRRKVARMEGGARLMESAHRALQSLDDEERGARAAIGDASHALARMPEELEDLIAARDQIDATSEILADVVRVLEAFLADGDHDPAALADAQDRLGLLLELTRKYGRTEAELILRLEQLEAQLGALETGDGLPRDLSRRRATALEALQTAGKSRSEAWTRTARRLAREASPLLDELGMKGAELRFDLIEETDASGPILGSAGRIQVFREGPARVRLAVRTNPGERFGAIERVASGGELSRIGLVLRSLTTRSGAERLLLLDEVDAGLGADLGPALAGRLRALSDRGQCLVITHLPAVAAAADVHLVARKETRKGRTSSTIVPVVGDARVEELTRMLGAHGDADREAAAALLAASATGGGRA